MAARPKRVARASLAFVMKTVESQRVHEQRRYIYELWTRELKTPAEIL
ncbi:MAG TPA: hypothetical protein VFW33_04335 [Gemmataceae bacterium]|nr:hypothetical protein [Gemmataceae bacterium]